jgi:hypothetical protein
MENCNYGYNELLVLQMVKSSVFGELKHAGAAYNHDLRSILFETRDEGLWRRRHHTLRNSNLYPTHGLGPVAFMLGINRGDAFDYIVSMSTRSSVSPSGAGTMTGRFSQVEGAIRHGGPEHVAHQDDERAYHSARARCLVAATVLAHQLDPGDQRDLEDYPARIYIEGEGEEDRWASIDSYKARYEHPLWREWGEKARSGGYGGMDYVMAFRLVQCLREGLVPDFDVYDAAAWSAPGPLSEMSVAKGSAPVKFPDFTRGKWREERPSL